MCSLGLWAKPSLTELNICCVKSFLKVAVAGIHVVGRDLRVHYPHKLPAPLAGNKWVDCVTLLWSFSSFLFKGKLASGSETCTFIFWVSFFFFFLCPFEVQLTGGMKQKRIIIPANPWPTPGILCHTELAPNKPPLEVSMSFLRLGPFPSSFPTSPTAGELGGALAGI